MSIIALDIAIVIINVDLIEYICRIDLVLKETSHYSGQTHWFVMLV